MSPKKVVNKTDLLKKGTKPCIKIKIKQKNVPVKKPKADKPIKYGRVSTEEAFKLANEVAQAQLVKKNEVVQSQVKRLKLNEKKSTITKKVVVKKKSAVEVKRQGINNNKTVKKVCAKKVVKMATPDEENKSKLNEDPESCKETEKTKRKKVTTSPKKKTRAKNYKVNDKIDDIDTPDTEEVKQNDVEVTNEKEIENIVDKKIQCGPEETEKTKRKKVTTSPKKKTRAKNYKVNDKIDDIDTPDTEEVKQNDVEVTNEKEIENIIDKKIQCGPEESSTQIESTATPTKVPPVLKGRRGRLKCKGKRIENNLEENPAPDTSIAENTVPPSPVISETFTCPKETSSSSSSSSTLICIDGKVPTVELTDIMLVERSTDTPKSLKRRVSITFSSPSTKRMKMFEEDSVCSRRPFNYSTSSSSITSSSATNCSNSSSMSKQNQALDKLSQILKRLDFEIINWIVREEDEAILNENLIDDVSFKVLALETDLVKLSHSVNKESLDLNKVNDDDDSVAYGEENDEMREIDDNIDQIGDEEEVERVESPVAPTDEKSEAPEDNYAATRQFADMVRQRSQEVNNQYDDGDTLSLFAAESIAGLDTRTNSSYPAYKEHFNKTYYEDNEDSDPESDGNDHENEYGIINPNFASPTFPKVDEVNEFKEPEVQMEKVNFKAICEKQNADSTSVNREVTPSTLASCVQTLKAANVMGPIFVTRMYKPVLQIKSLVFKGCCFFNLKMNCNKREMCQFRHVIPSKMEICQRLTKLTEQLFIMEYMLLRNEPHLRERYLMCYVDECRKRSLTRLLVEMAIDNLIMEKIEIKVHIIEITLLHLNEIDLETIRDLLVFETGRNHLLCDVLMTGIALTQNFSRFKQVFVNLTNFFVSLQRRFDINVATPLFERILILPYEKQLALSVIKILGSTSPVIFEHKFMQKFQDMLMMDSEVFNEFLKCRANVMTVDYNVPTASQEIEAKRYTSPDTTNTDRLAQQQVEIPTTRLPKNKNLPLIRRTVDGMNRTRTFIPPPTSSNVLQHDGQLAPTTSLNEKFAQGWANNSPNNLFKVPYNKVTPRKLIRPNTMQRYPRKARNGYTFPRPPRYT